MIIENDEKHDEQYAVMKNHIQRLENIDKSATDYENISPPVQITCIHTETKDNRLNESYFVL